MYDIPAKKKKNCTKIPKVNDAQPCVTETVQHVQLVARAQDRHDSVTGWWTRQWLCNSLSRSRSTCHRSARAVPAPTQWPRPFSQTHARAVIVRSSSQWPLLSHQACTACTSMSAHTPTHTHRCPPWTFPSLARVPKAAVLAASLSNVSPRKNRIRISGCVSLFKFHLSFCKVNVVENIPCRGSDSNVQHICISLSSPSKHLFGSDTGMFLPVFTATQSEVAHTIYTIPSCRSGSTYLANCIHRMSTAW